MFCPKCGSILLPKKEGSKKVLACSCGYKSKDTDQANIKEQKIDKERKVEIVDTELETLPIMDADCPKCGNKKAYFWLVQTRASDEPETKFIKCTKCKNIWRDYT